jgi:UDP-glucose:(heptosyl)LPS alpha-1,3-glucosyltransferase
LNIGLVIERMDPGLGGAEQWTYQFARWLLAQGHEVHVIAAAVADSVKRLGVVAHELGAARRRVRFAAEAERAARSLPLDIVHDMGRGWSCDVFHPHNGSRSAAFEHNLLAEPNWKRPWKRAGHALLPRYRDFDRLMARQYVADGRLYVAVSRMVAEHFRTFHGVCESRIRRIYNGVDVRRFSPDRRVEFREPTRRRLGVRDDELLLLIVAHNPRLKGVPAVIRACAELGRRGVPARLAVVGGRPLWSHQRLARRLGVANRVAFIGAVNDPVHLYMAADVYVQPTFYDPCSLVVLEAMACGLPVVTTRHNGVSERADDQRRRRPAHQRPARLARAGGLPGVPAGRGGPPADRPGRPPVGRGAPARTKLPRGDGGLPRDRIEPRPHSGAAVSRGPA